MRLTFISLFLFFYVFSFSQLKEMNTALRFLSQQANSSAIELNILIQGNIEQLKTNESNLNYKIIYTAENLASISCNYTTLISLIEKGIINYCELPTSKKRPLNDTMIYRNRIKQVKLWTSPLPQAYNGEGVLMGIIDSGIDFSHPDFKDSLGNTRIRFLWDQTVATSSNSPSPFNYGRQWTAVQINNNQCTHSDAAYWGHGTHVSGIAAGNGKANGTHEGIASKSDLIVVALDFNRVGPTIADAITYIFNKAQQIGRPCVVNASVGDYYGSHDGTDLETKLINSLLVNKPGRVLVAAAGNAGSYKYHVKTQSTATDTVFSWLNNNTNLVEYWCYGDTNQLKNIKISIGANRINFSNLGKTPFRNYKAGATSIKKDTLFYNTKRIGIVEMSSSVNSSGVCEWYYRIRPDSVNTFWRIETIGNGLQHAWNFDFVSTGLPTIAQYPKMNKHIMPDTLYTMVSGFQNSDEVITVGNYVNLYQYLDVNNQVHSINQTGGQISQTSSNGPTRDNRIKPDVTATGESVFSAIVLSLKASFLANEPYKVANGGFHILGGGTSAASPVVAGLAALYLQRYPNATNQQVKDAIRNCAYHDAYTGNNLPNYIWGFGKLDGKATMTCSDVKVFTGMQLQELNQISYYPNPAKDKIIFSLQHNNGGHYFVFDTSGRLVLKGDIMNKDFEINLNQINDYQGLLLVQINNGLNQYTVKVVKE